MNEKELAVEYHRVATLLLESYADEEPKDAIDQIGPPGAL